jgi:hypothetical protein
MAGVLVMSKSVEARVTLRHSPEGAAMEGYFVAPVGERMIASSKTLDLLDERIVE